MANFSYRTLNSQTYSDLLFETVTQLEESGDPKELPYIDSVGIVTIGIGFNLQQGPAITQTLENILYPDAPPSDSVRLADEIYIQRLNIEFAKTWTDLSEMRNALDSIMIDRANDPNVSYNDKRISFSFENEADIRSVFDNTIGISESVVENSVSGIPLSTEKAVLVSLAYNSPALIGPSLQQALEDGNRAEAWFEIRYNSNGGASRSEGIARRRFFESDEFGLYNPGELDEFEARQIFEMATRHEADIDAYEAEFGNQIQIANEINQFDQTLLTLEEALLPAKVFLENLYTEGAPIDNIIVPEEGDIEDIDLSVDPEKLDEGNLILDNDVGKIITAGNEDDYIVGGGGEDTITGGQGSDTFIWSRGDDSDTITDYAALDGDILRLSGGDITLEDLSFSRAANFGEDFRSARITIDGIEGGEIVVQGLLDVFSNPSDSIARQPLLNIDVENPDGSITEKTILLTTSGTIALDSQGNPQIFDRIAPEEDGNLNIDLLDGVKTAVFTNEGDDLIINNTSANIIATGNGNDVVQGISAGDFIYFGGGTDTLDLTATTADIFVDSNSLQIEGITISLGNQFSGLVGSLENITLGSGNDTARFSSGRVIDGGEGVDTVFSTPELVVTEDGTIVSEFSSGFDTHFVNFETVSFTDAVYSEGLGITYDGVSTRQFFDYSEIGHGIRFEQTDSNEITVSDITGTNSAQDTIIVEDLNGNPSLIRGLVAGTDNGDQFIFNQTNSTISANIWLGSGDDTVELASTAFGATEYFYTGGNDRFIVEDAPSFGGRPEIIFAIDGLTQNDISLQVNGSDFLYTIGDHGTISIEGIGNGITLSNPEQIKVVGATPQDDVIIAANLPSSSPFNVNPYEGEFFSDGGSGNDYIDYSGGDFAVRTLYGRTGDDTLIDGDQANELLGGTGNDTLIGNGGDDILFGGDGDDILQGGAGNDTLRGGFGNDTYVFAEGDGFEVIDDIYGTNILRVEGNLNPQDFVYSRIGDDLQIDIASGVTIKGYFANEDTIETIVIDDGATFDLRDLIAGGREEVAPELINENGNVTATIETVEEAYDFVPEPQAFPDLVERARLDPDLVNGANRENLTFSDDRQLDIRFVEEGAGFKNSLGMYTVGADGTLENVQLLAENLSGTGNGVFGGGDFNAGDLLASMEVEAGTEIGFFIIANGFNRNKGFKKFDTENGTLEFRTSRKGDLSEIDDGKAKLFFTDDATGKEFKVKGDIWHASSTSLNKDGEMHAVTGELEEGTLTLGFEDLRNLGDADYNDVVIEIEVSPTTTFMLDPVAVAPDLTVLDEDDGMLSEVMIELDSGFQSGDLLTIDESLIEDTNISFSQTSDTSILLTGDEDAAIYQEIINSLMFNNLTERPEDGERNINITVTDVDGLMDSTDIVVEVSLNNDQDLNLQITDVLHMDADDPLGNLVQTDSFDSPAHDVMAHMAETNTGLDQITQQQISEFG